MINLRAVLGGAVALLLLSAAAEATAQSAFDRDGWLRELDQTRDVLTTDYANLEWAATHRLTLSAAYERARTGVQRAQDDAAARTALRQFTGSFADGHLFITWPPTTATPAQVPASTQDAAASAPTPCDLVGRGQLSDTAGLVAHMSGYQSLETPDSAIIPAGFIEAGSKRLGVLRIAGFGHQGYPGVCDEVARELSLTEGPCDDACKQRLGNAATARYLQAISRQINALAASRPDALLIDLAMNGGGDDTAEAIARMLTTRRLQSANVGLLRTDATAAYLDEELAKLTAQSEGSDGIDRAMLQAAIVRIRGARAQAAEPCDRSPLWRNERITCSQLIMGSLYATLWFNGAEEGIETRSWADWAYVPARYPYEPGLWNGPLLILVDHGTASAAEQFTAVLRDNRAALIIGDTTLGAGCGHWLSRPPVRLTHSGGMLAMPDCARFRADGSNEVGGIEPDLLLPLRTNDSLRQRAARLQKALPTVERLVEEFDSAVLTAPN